MVKGGLKEQGQDFGEFIRTDFEQIPWDSIMACGFVFFDVEQEFKNSSFGYADFLHGMVRVGGNMFGSGGGGKNLREKCVEHVGLCERVLNQGFS